MSSKVDLIPESAQLASSITLPDVGTHKTRATGDGGVDERCETAFETGCDLSREGVGEGSTFGRRRGAGNVTKGRKRMVSRAAGSAGV